jgi:hypothetical protein
MERWLAPLVGVLVGVLAFGFVVVNGGPFWPPG